MATSNKPTSFNMWNTCDTKHSVSEIGIPSCTQLVRQCNACEQISLLPPLNKQSLTSDNTTIKNRTTKLTDHT